VTIASAAITLLLLMDPLGNAPIFMSVLGKLTPRRRRIAVVRELLFALAILLIFLFFGQVILQALNISQPALAVAGGVVLFIVALRMIFPGRHGGFAEEGDPDPWVVPLAVPMVAGPSAMAWVMLLSTGSPDRMTDWLIAIGIAWSVTGGVLLASAYLQGYLKEGGLRALERLMGMILIVIAVQMLMDGVGRFLAHYGIATPVAG
jgi:multiple antibiotic resistance protein